MIIIVNKEIIKSLKPCADRYENYLKYYSDFDGQLEEFLDLENITYQDKIWLAVRLMPIFLVEVFAIDCAVRAAAATNYATNYAAHCAAYAAHCAAYAAHCAANCAAAAADAAHGAANCAADAADAAYYAYYAAERQNQIESIIYLIQNYEHL